MAQDVTVNLKVTGLDKAATDVNKVESKTNDLGDSFKGLEGAADKFTGGLVSGLRGAVTGVKQFITGLKLTKTAIIATGVGGFSCWHNGPNCGIHQNPKGCGDVRANNRRARCYV